MNKQQLAKLIGTVLKLRPRPQRDGEPIPEARNRWHLLNESEDKKGLVLKNVITDHEFVLSHDSINQYRSPDLLVLRGQPVFQNERSVVIEPFIDASEAIVAEEPLDIVADRFRLAEVDLHKLTDAERAAVRQLIVQEKMTDTDVSRFLEAKGFGSYPNFYQSVSNRVAFLERDFFGSYFVRSSFKPVLRQLLAQQTGSPNSCEPRTANGFRSE